MKEYNIIVNFEDNTIETDLKKLVQNDYNSIKINFEIDKEYDKALFELKYPSGNTLQMLIKDNELVLPRGILNEIDEYEYEISIYNAEGKLTHFKTKTFEVREELVKDSEDIVNDDRYGVLSDLINETTEKLNKVNKVIEDVESFKEEIRNDENLKGPKGDSFTYEDFTPEQLEALKGQDGEKGDKGDSFKFEDFTEEQLNDLKQSIADSLEFENYDDTEIKERLAKIEERLGLLEEEVFKLTATCVVSKNDDTCILTVTSDSELQELEGCTLSEDKLTLTKILEENVAGEITILGIKNQKLTLQYDAAPNIEVTNISNRNEDGTWNRTNKPVTITIVSDKELAEPEGLKESTISKDKKTLTFKTEKSGNNIVKVYDEKGNSTSITYIVESVDTMPPEIISDGTGAKVSYRNGVVTATLRITEKVSISDSSWTDISSVRFTKKYQEEEIPEDGITEVITFTDFYNNSTTFKIMINKVEDNYTISYEEIENVEHVHNY